MVWQKLILLAEPEMASQLETCLNEEGALAITLEDGAHESLYEKTPLEMTVWTALKLTGLFASQVDITEVMHRLERKCERTLTFQLEELHDQVWETVWQENFKPIRFGEKLWVCPSWCEPPQPSAVNLILDPGLAFGTGTHETTALCLEWLERRDLTGKTVVDFGCGSGILAIAALLLGSDKAIGIDNDPHAIAASRSNGRKNNLHESRLSVFLPQHIPAIEADIVMANILAGPLVELAGRIISLTKPAGSILLSGVLTSQREEVIKAYESAVEIKEVQVRGDWICLHGYRHTS